MKVICRNVRTFRSILKILCRISPELIIIPTTRYLEIKGISTNHLIFFDCKIYSSFFERYECDQKENFSICLKSEVLDSILSRIPVKDKIEIEFVNKSLIFQLNKPYTRKFMIKETKKWDRSIKLIDFEGYDIKLSSDVFYHIIADASKIADEITINLFKNVISFSAGNEFCSFICKMGVNKKIEENVIVIVLTSILALINPIISKSNMVLLKLANNKPLFLILYFDNAHITFVISSRR